MRIEILLRDISFNLSGGILLHSYCVSRVCKALFVLCALLEDYIGEIAKMGSLWELGLSIEK